MGKKNKTKFVKYDFTQNTETAVSNSHGRIRGHSNNDKNSHVADDDSTMERLNNVKVTSSDATIEQKLPQQATTESNIHPQSELPVNIFKKRDYTSRDQQIQNEKKSTSDTQVTSDSMQEHIAPDTACDSGNWTLEPQENIVPHGYEYQDSAKSSVWNPNASEFIPTTTTPKKDTHFDVSHDSEVYHQPKPSQHDDNEQSNVSSYRKNEKSRQYSNSSRHRSDNNHNSQHQNRRQDSFSNNTRHSNRNKSYNYDHKRRSDYQRPYGQEKIGLDSERRHKDKDYGNPPTVETENWDDDCYNQPNISERQNIEQHPVDSGKHSSSRGQSGSRMEDTDNSWSDREEPSRRSLPEAKTASDVVSSRKHSRSRGPSDPKMEDNDPSWNNEWSDRKEPFSRSFPGAKTASLGKHSSSRGTHDPRMERERKLKEREGTEDFETVDKSCHNNDWLGKKDPSRRSYPESKSKTASDRVSLPSRELYDRSFEKIDDEFREFNEHYRRDVQLANAKVEEREQDLFDMPQEYSMGHCVAEDMRMGSGIAVNFKRDFKELDTLLSQRQKQGGLAVLEKDHESGTRYIYYLVTKRTSSGKPTYETFWNSLKKMRDHIKENGVKKLTIPRIGCGLDRLEWSKVKYMIEFLFRDVNVEIVVCNFQQNDDTPQKSTPTTRLVHHYEPLKDIDQYTIILYFSTEDGHESEEMRELNKKFNFLIDFRKSPKHFGTTVRHKWGEYILYGCIVRKNVKSLFDFKSFAQCLSEISRNNRKDKYEYVALEPVYDPCDDILNEKVITLLRFYLRQVDIYICTSGKAVDDVSSPVEAERQ